MTATLLARKGDAAPSMVAPAAAPLRPVLVPREYRPTASPQPPDNGEKLRRVMVVVTSQELERLDIAAIKKGTNRHGIVRGALDDFFRKLSTQLPYPCACMEVGPAIAARHVESTAAEHSYSARGQDLESAIVAMTTAERR